MLNTTQTEVEDQQNDDRRPPQNPIADEGTTGDLLMEEEIPFTSNLTNYMEHSLQPAQAMQTTFVSNSPSMPEQIERVTTPVDMDMSLTNGPLDPVFTRPTQQEDLDTQTKEGTRETANITSDLLDNFLDENYADVLRTSVLDPHSYMSLPSMKTSPPTSEA